MAPHPGTSATMAFGLAVIAFVLTGVAGLVFQLWWRSRHPLEGPGSLEEALREEEAEGEDWR